MARFMLLLALACSSLGAGTASKTGECIRAADGSCKDGDDATLLQSRTYLDEEASDLLEMAESDEHQAGGDGTTLQSGPLPSSSITSCSSSSTGRDCKTTYDGNTASGWFQDYDCDIAPYVELNLDNAYKISRVIITQRTCCQPQELATKVTVSGDSGSTDLSSAENNLVISGDVAVSGKKIKIQAASRSTRRRCSWGVDNIVLEGVVDKAFCWSERWNGMYVSDYSSKECYDDLESAKTKCIEAKDCYAIATQSNICGGKYRVTHGEPTFKSYGKWQAYNLWAYKLDRSCTTGQVALPIGWVAPPKDTCLIVKGTPKAGYPDMTGTYYRDHKGVWCRDDGGMIFRFATDTWVFWEASSCVMKAKTKSEIAKSVLGAMMDDYSSNRPRVEEINCWGKCGDLVPQYQCPNLKECSTFKDQASCPSFRCAWDGSSICDSIAEGVKVEVRNAPHEEWQRGLVKGSIPLMVAVYGSTSIARIWKEVRVQKKTLRECLAEKECFDKYFGNSPTGLADAKECFACTDPNEEVSDTCQKHRECIRQQRATLTDHSYTLLRNLNLVAGRPANSAALLQARTTDQGWCSDQDNCLDPRTKEFAKVMQDCGCLTSFHDKCDAAADGGSTQQQCLREIGCADKRICCSWKRAQRGDDSGFPNCPKGQLAQVGEATAEAAWNDTNLLQESSLDESMSTKKTCR